MIGDVRSGLFGFARQIAGGLSRTAGLGLGFWQTFRGSGVWITRGLQFNQTHASRATAHRPALLQAGARSTRRGLRVGVVNSFEGGLVGVHWLSKKGIGSTSAIVRRLIVSMAQLQL